MEIVIGLVNRHLTKQGTHEFREGLLRTAAARAMENRLNESPELEQKKDPKSARMNDILAAALEEFFQQGFAAARLDSIAERAGIGKGTIYLYFDSKEALFEEAVMSILRPIFEQAERVTAVLQGSAADMLRGLITTLYREFIGTERRRILRLLIAEGPRFPRLIDFYHREVIQRGMAALRGILGYGMARGEFRSSLPLDYPQVIIGPAIVGAIWQLLFQELEPLDIDGLCNAHIDIILNGLLARNEPTETKPND
jgi:AcrR family transcriptional regulator